MQGWHACRRRRPMAQHDGQYGRYSDPSALSAFTDTPSREREAAVEAAVRLFARKLEEQCRQEPYNWFNFFDFWRGPHGK